MGTTSDNIADAKAYVESSSTVRFLAKLMRGAQQKGASSIELTFVPDGILKVQLGSDTIHETACSAEQWRGLQDSFINKQ